MIALLQTGLASSITGLDGCSYAMLQVMRSALGTCEEDPSVTYVPDLPWLPSPCGSCSGVSCTETCAKNAPRAVGCDCDPRLLGLDCASGLCAANTDKCADPSTAPLAPVQSCDTRSPCSVGVVNCDRACCTSFGFSYYSYRSRGSNCYCAVCSK